MRLDILIAGVGGQGNVLASRILARAAMEAGLPVRTSEVIGMAQREGVVMSQVRMGQGDYSALIPTGQADVLLGLELAETVRAINKVKKGAVVLANTATIQPVSVSLGLATYDTRQLTAFLQERTATLHLFDATALASQAGTFKATNMVLLGALSALDLLPFSADHLQSVVEKMMPPRLLPINQRAFALGRQAIGGA
ncbi:indolepyruvate oxidoreductase subunit beta [Desulforamulus hydrothermalis]|uniref:Indolepyruvate oxidoreductase subunit iorB n=1 Tax=Desulforamulus hydrothermalis Lam5 = DSM 18033 TaxID=1121428 RepID=K8EKJ7_9FIRM|nr:indolepyruvate oxidoreductase subunit beta [Desulforamulus hydrothermalis]CCO09076.1 Indolepyruvate oxidoreductase subunit iorB [Desulforamulus hydrothermalis Lam5 = DSM 18033]SHG78466.1 indolepyruvate ferredoxin oxidoreductase beta subunit [Desulforamulus hydrothermalis Lam5 = DSM 18033]